MIADRPALGISLMLGFCMTAPLGDALAKILSETVPVMQLLLVRFGTQAVVLLPIVWFANIQWRVNGPVLWLVFIRSILHIIGIGSMFISLYYLPLADAVAIAFVMPFIILLLGKFILSEEVGPRRLTACLVGFTGTMMVIQPSFVAIGWPALWPLVVAFSFSLFMLVTRQIAKAVDPIGLQAISGVIACAILVPPLILFQDKGIQPISLIWPTFTQFWILGAIGILGTSAHLLMTWALRLAPSATLAPMQYLEIPVATLLGWLIFADLPNRLATVGIIVTIVAGLYIILKERAIARASA